MEEYSGLIGGLVVLAVIVGGIAFLYILGGLFIVQPRTQVVVLRFGKYQHTIVEEGLAGHRTLMVAGSPDGAGTRVDGIKGPVAPSAPPGAAMAIRNTVDART